MKHRKIIPLRIAWHRALWHLWKIVAAYAEARARSHRAAAAKKTCAEFTANRGNLAP